MLCKFYKQLLFVLILATQIPAAHATGIPVFDAASIAQAITQVQNQITQLAKLQAQINNQIQMIQNQARMVQSLGQSPLSGLSQSVASLNQLLEVGNTITYNIDNWENQVRDLYPDSTYFSSETAQEFSKIKQSWAAQRAAQNSAMFATQNAIKNSQADIASRTTTALAASTSAAGQKAAMQASNELLAAISAQLMQTQTLMLAEQRQQTINDAEEEAKKRRLDVIVEKFLQ